MMIYSNNNYGNNFTERKTTTENHHGRVRGAPPWRFGRWPREQVQARGNAPFKFWPPRQAGENIGDENTGLYAGVVVVVVVGTLGPLFSFRDELCVARSLGWCEGSFFRWVGQNDDDDDDDVRRAQQETCGALTVPGRNDDNNNNKNNTVNWPPKLGLSSGVARHYHWRTN